MKHTTRYFLYAWKKSKPVKINMGKKVSKKTTYISSASAREFWDDLGADKLKQYCIFESDDDAVVSAAEWWGLNYGMSILGKDKFYNKFNNAHKGDQSLVTEEIKAKIVDFYKGRLIAEDLEVEYSSLGSNIIDKVENGVYDIVNISVHELLQYAKNQARAVTRNIANEDEIVKSYTLSPKQVMRDITPMTILERKNGSREIVNGHTRLGAASRCKGWNEIPCCIVSEKEFGKTKQEIESNIILAGSYANRISPVTTQTNTDDDLVFQMEKWLEIEGLSYTEETTHEYIRELLSNKFAPMAGSKHKASGIVTKIFNNLEKNKNELSINQNLITYTDSELSEYCYETYEKHGIAVVRSTISNLKHFGPVGFVFNHVCKMSNMPEKLAVVLHCRSKNEYVKLNDLVKKYLKKSKDGQINQIKKIFFLIYSEYIKKSYS